MTFLRPDLFWLAVLAPLAVLGAAAYAHLRRRETTRRLGALVPALAVGASRRRRHVKAALVATAVLWMAVALARPRYGTHLRDGTREGLDLVVALDVSKSMWAEDVSPSRLEKAKVELGRLLDRLRGDRVALVLFAGDAFVQAPLTADYGALRLFLDTAAPDALPTPGTDFGVALDAALDAFGPKAPQGVAQPARVLLFVSDGENHVADLATIRARAEEAGVTVLAAGVGEAEPVPVPDYGPDGEPLGPKRDASGAEVLSKLEDDALKALSDNRYVHLGRTGTLAGPVETLLSGLERTALEEDPFAEYAEQFVWPLLLALGLLLADLLLNERPRRAAAQEDAASAPEAPARAVDTAPRPPPAARVPPVAAALAALLLAGCGARGDGMAGNRALAFGDGAAAVRHYLAGLERQRADGDTLAGSVRARLFHNLGVAFLDARSREMAADSSEAAAARFDSLAGLAFGAFERAFAASATDRLRHAAAYGAGLGAAAAGDDAAALDRFRTALGFAPTDEDAAYNWEFVARQRRDRSGGQSGAQQDGDGAQGQGERDPEDGQGQQRDDQQTPGGDPKEGTQTPEQGADGDAQNPQGAAETSGEAPAARLSREEAARILDAVGQEEGRVRRSLRTRAPSDSRVEKDW